MYDTLMQMGRWFGYRPGYLDVCRLYLTQPLEDWFTVITEAAEELREEFNIAIQMNLTPREYGLKVMHHPALMVTSPVKMRAAQEIALNFSLSGTLQETVNFFRDDTKLQNNLDALSNFLKNMGPWTIQNVQRDRETTVQKWGNSVLWENIPASKVLEFLDQYKTHPAARKAGSEQSAQFIREMNESGELLKWNVAVIGGNTRNNPVQLTPDIQIKPVFRRATTITENGYSIGCLPSSRDESIDVDYPMWKDALEMSKAAWKQDPGNAKKEPEVPAGPVIRRLRGFGNPESNILPGNPLLMLYLVNVHREDEEISPSDLSGKIAGFCISYPFSRNSSVTIRYCVNNVFLEEMYYDD